MARIPLTRGMFALVDDADFVELNKFKWCAHKIGDAYYASRNGRREDGKQVTILMHRQITNCPEGLDVDHIDGDGLNNQRNNIRQATRRQNLQNLHQKTSSIYPGVHWNKAGRCWYSRIWKDGKRIYLGRFQHEEDARDTYLSELNKYGEELLEAKT